MPLNHYVSLGRSGLKVSPMCLGAATFGQEWGWGSSPEDSVEVLETYMDKGGNFIDTSNMYTYGHSEKIIGDYFKQHAAKRHRAVIATKFFAAMESGDPNSGGGSRKAIIRSCEDSLRRLQTDFIDLYWMHCLDIHTPIEETLRALEQLVCQGKIRYIGFSDTPAWVIAQARMLADARGWEPVAALQMEYSLLQRGIEGEVIPCAREFGLGLAPWSPLKSGALSGKYSRENHGKLKDSRGGWATKALNEKTYCLLDAIAEIAKEHEATVAQVSIAWLLAKEAVTAPIMGARTIKQLTDNLGALDVRLTLAEVDRLDKLTTPELDFPAGMVEEAGPFRSSGCHVNGEDNEVHPLIPASFDEVY